MEVTAVPAVLRGELPTWADGYGSGYGSGDGSGYGYGYGDGSGYDIARCSPLPVVVTAADLRKRKACADQVRIFECIFPAGATWPEDAEKAGAAGLDLGWARTNLGLMDPRTG